MPFFDGAAGRVYYRAWRVADPVAGVVFLHGFREHTGFYHRFADALTHRSIEVWACDQVGHGLSAGPRGIAAREALVENARRLTALAEKAPAGVPLVLIGHSMGGMAAAVLAGREPERFAGLVLTGAPLSRPPTAETEPEPDGISNDAFYLDAIENDPLGFPESSEVEQRLFAELDAARPEIEERLVEFEGPVLLINGGLDTIAPPTLAERWTGRLENARALSYEGMHHDILNDTVHGEVAAEITQFVTAAARSRSIV